MLHKVTVLKVMGARGAKRAWLACCLRLWDFVHLDAKPAPVRGSAGPQRLKARWMGRLKLARQPQGFLMNKNASWIQSGSISTQGKKKPRLPNCFRLLPEVFSIARSSCRSPLLWLQVTWVGLAVASLQPGENSVSAALQGAQC